MEYSSEELEKIKREFALTEEEYNTLFERCKWITFYGCTISDNPTAVFVGGQTGSGKGGIDVYSEKELLKENINAALIDVDVYRALYPNAEKILNKYPTIYTDITAKATGKIVKEIIKYAIEQKYSFIFEGTMRNIEAFETMKAMPDYFKKIVRVMAVPKTESLLTAFERNDEQINLSGYGRFTNVKTHNATFDGVLETIKTIEKENSNIIIEIFIRGEDMTTPIRVFSSKDSKEKPSDIISKYRETEKQKLNKDSTQRLERLLNNLRPKDIYEEEQLKKLVEEINNN